MKLARVTAVSKNTVTKLLIDAGRACTVYHDENVRNVEAKRVQVDEIWSFVYAKQRNVATAKRLDLAYGDVWTWTAIDADSKLILVLSGWRVRIPMKAASDSDGKAASDSVP